MTYYPNTGRCQAVTQQGQRCTRAPMRTGTSVWFEMPEYSRYCRTHHFQIADQQAAERAAQKSAWKANKAARAAIWEAAWAAEKQAARAEGRRPRWSTARANARRTCRAL